MDFFKVEVLSLRGPIRYAVLVVMDLRSRRVQIAGIIREPQEDWMLQVLRNLTDAMDRFLLCHVYLIMDRDPVPLVEAHLRRLVRAYLSHDHEERPHQGLSGEFVAGSSLWSDHTHHRLDAPSFISRQVSSTAVTSRG